MRFRHHGEVMRALARIERKVDQLMSEQAAIDQDVAAVTAAITDLQAQNTALANDVTAIKAEIASLQSQGVDTSALDAAVASLTSTQQAIDATVGTATAIVPPAPAPAPGS